METRNAIIESARIVIHEGMLTAQVTLKYDSCHQMFGGRALYLHKSFKHHELKSIAGHFIYRVMEIAGVKNWDNLPGKTIRAKSDVANIYQLGHIIEDDWFNPEKEA